ncbi:MAG: dihydropteroate synthase [Polyangiaceae bacterium]
MIRRREKFFSALEGAVRTRGVALMGICNVTPDSFSDGGQYLTREAAFARVDALFAEGADMVDIGGESTRPRALPVSAKDQLARAVDVVRYAAGKGAVSIDTADPEVASACFEAGASALNDVSCLRNDELARVTAQAGAAYVLMHSRGTQTEMKGFGEAPADAYGDVVEDVLREWEEAAARARSSGVGSDALVMDPGLGFAKAARHSMELLARTRELALRAKVPVLIGASRKSFLRLVDADALPADRLGASLAAAVYAARAGAQLLRVHDVRATKQALDLDRLLSPPKRDDEVSRA